MHAYSKGGDELKTLDNSPTRGAPFVRAQRMYVQYLFLSEGTRCQRSTENDEKEGGVAVHVRRQHRELYLYFYCLFEAKYSQ